MPSATVKLVTESAAKSVKVARFLASDCVLHATPAEARALLEATALLERASAILLGVAGGRVEARAKFTLLKKAA